MSSVSDSKCTCGTEGVGSTCNVGDTCNIKQYTYPGSKLVLRTEWDACLKIMDEKKIVEPEKTDNCKSYMGCIIEQLSTKAKDEDVTKECRDFTHYDKHDDKTSEALLEDNFRGCMDTDRIKTLTLNDQLDQCASYAGCLAQGIIDKVAKEDNLKACADPAQYFSCAKPSACKNNNQTVKIADDYCMCSDKTCKKNGYCNAQSNDKCLTKPIDCTNKSVNTNPICQCTDTVCN